MESEPGAHAAAANSAAAATVNSAASSSTTAASSSSTSSNAAAAATSTTSSGSSITNSSASSSTTAGRQAAPQISVYSGMPDRQTVQVSFLCLCIWVFVYTRVCDRRHKCALLCRPLLVQRHMHQARCHLLIVNECY